MEMIIEGNTGKRKIHPYKFTLWLAMGSIVMMFAALTSAYIVKQEQANWLLFPLPKIFTVSTIVIIVSSVTMYFAVKTLKKGNKSLYRLLVSVTAILGILFSVLQFSGFRDLQDHGVKIIGAGSNAAASFLGVIAGLHVLHVTGGVVALLILLFVVWRKKNGVINSTPAELIGTYWHFVDILWVYLFIFFNLSGR